MTDSHAVRSTTRPPWVKRASRSILPLLPPFVALAVQAFLWDRLISPHVWFLLFYPAVVASAWLGSKRQGFLAAALSAAMVWWFFIPPEHTLAKDPRALVAVAAFLITSTLIVLLQDRERRATTHLQKVSDEARAFGDQLASLVAQAPDGIFAADLEGRYTDVNEAGCRMLGYRRDELLRKTIFDLIPPEEADRLVQSKEKLLKGGSQVEEWVLRKKDGSYIPVELNAWIMPDGRWQAFVRDISERKRLEASLAETAADLNRAQFVAEVGSWRLDVHRNELRWSDENYRIFGVKPGTPMTYEAFLACIHPEDRQYVDERWQAALRGEPYDIEHRLLVDGVVKWVREKADLQMDERGALLGGIGITQDLSERKRLEDALRFSEARSSGILSISADAIISVDEDRRITLFNTGAEKIFGRSRDELMGAPLDVLIPEAVRAVHREHVNQFAAGREGARRMGERPVRIYGVRKNGEEFPADAAISKLVVGGKTVLTVALRDVTEQARLEDELRRAIRSRDEVLAIVAHDLRGPLHSVVLQAGLLRRPGPEPERRTQRPIERIERAAKQMSRLIQDLLEITRIEAGHLAIEPTRVSAAQVISDLVDAHELRASEVAVTVQLEVPPDVPDVWADRHRLGRVFENLLSNALKCTPRGGRISIGATPKDGEVLFWVADTGIGIAPEHLPHIFDRYWQARAARQGGAGLGLAFVKGVVDAHGGRIWVESTPGRGSTFFFTVPTAPATEQSIEPRPSLG